MNVQWSKLSNQRKVVVSSISLGLLSSLDYYLSSNFGNSDQEFLGIDSSYWVYSVFLGLLLAWSELWKKDIRKALLNFAAGAGIYLLMMVLISKLPDPLNVLFGYIHLLFPVSSMLFYAKLCLAKDGLVKDNKLLMQAYLSGILLNLLAYNLPALIGGGGLLLIFGLLKAPLFYFLYYRLEAGQRLLELLKFKISSRPLFIFSYLFTWSLLGLCLYNLAGRLPFMDVGGMGSEDFERYMVLYRLGDIIYSAMIVLGLGQICIEILSQYHQSIRKPLGWSYLLCFVPLLNIFSLIYLFKYKAGVDYSLALWQKESEASREKIVLGMIIITVVGFCLSVVMGQVFNSYMTEDGIYFGIFLTALTALVLQAIYKGWASFFTIAVIYLSLYACFIVVGDIGGPANLIARALGLLIYYKAIRPTANKEIEQELSLSGS